MGAQLPEMQSVSFWARRRCQWLQLSPGAGCPNWVHYSCKSSVGVWGSSVLLPSQSSSQERAGSGLPFMCHVREGAEAPSPWQSAPGTGLWWGQPSDGPCLCFLWGECVSLLGWPAGRVRKTHPGFCWWFRLWTSCPFKAYVIAGISKSSPWKFKFTENILTRAKQQLQGCLKGLNCVPESPLQRLAPNTSFPRNALCSVTELSAFLSLLRSWWSRTTCEV